MIIYHSLSLRQRLGGHKYEGEPNKLCPQNMAKGGCHTCSASFDLDLLLPVPWFTETPLSLFLSFFHSHPTYFAYWHHQTVFPFQPSRTCWVNGSPSHRLSLEARFAAHVMCGYSFVFALHPLLLCWLLFNDVMLLNSAHDVR